MNVSTNGAGVTGLAAVRTGLFSGHFVAATGAGKPHEAICKAQEMA
jgi:hypothetical protein